MQMRGYAVITASYWGFTLTDGALRMLVLLHFHTLGYTPLDLALLFLLYEFFGVVTNLFGGWIGSRVGLRRTLFAGLALQVIALVMLSGVDPTWVRWLSVGYVMAAQALSGIAKDLTKLSSKSAVKLLVPDDDDSRFFRWVAWLTGSKNALKGLGFLMGGVLLGSIGFVASLWVMAGALTLVLIGATAALRGDLGMSKSLVPFTQILSKSYEINVLSTARFCLFGARDVWFAVGLPLFLYDVAGWSFTGVSSFLAVWVVGYGAVQAAAPRLLQRDGGAASASRLAQTWGFALAVVAAAIAAAVSAGFYSIVSVVGGLALFGIVFAVNSSVHSYLILAYTDADRVAANVGFYYMANAAGRLVGTLLSGALYLAGGLSACLWGSTLLVLAAAALALALPSVRPDPAMRPA
jgi:MFS family permease